MNEDSFGPSEVVTKVESLAPGREGGRAMLAPRIPRGKPHGTFIITCCEADLIFSTRFMLFKFF